MTLSDFIKLKGDPYCAILFGASERTVASWRRGENFPRAKKAQQIVTLTDGLVTMAGIYAPPAAPPQQLALTGA